MYTVWIIVAVLFLFGALNGLRKGLIKSVFSTFALIAALVLAAWGGPYVAKFLVTTPVYATMCDKVENAMSDQLGEVTGAQEEVSGQISGQINAINALPLPEELKKGLIENNNSQIYEMLGIDQFTQYIARYICILIMNVLAYIVVFLLAYIVLKIIGLLLDDIAQLPVLSTLNRLGGLILGMINGVLAVWVMFVVITLFCTTDWGQEAYRQINASPVLTLVYDHNLLLDIIKNIGNTL